MSKVLTVTTIIAVLYLGWVFGRRWMENRRLEHRAAQPAPLPKQYRTDSLKILQFFSPRPRVVCYGVLNAIKIRITPEPGEVAASLSRCLDVHITESTEFTITAESQSGATTSQEIIVHAH